MTPRKLASFFVALFVLFTMASARAAEPEASTTAAPETKNSYVDFLIGGQIPAKGLSGLDSRFALGFESGSNSSAFPLTVSFGQSTYIVGVKPRFQFTFRPFSALKDLAIIPGFGPVLNYWRVSTAGGNSNGIEVGIQPSVRLRYDVLSWLNVMFVPFEMDFNLYRYVWVAGNNGGNSDLQIFYNISAAVGFNY